MRVLCLLMLAVLLCSGCPRKDTPVAPATRPAGNKITIGYCAPEWGGAQYQIMQGVRSRAEALGWHCTVLNANFDAQVQARQVEYLIQTGARAIVAVPLDSGQIEESIQKAHAKDVLFYTVDRAPSRGKVELIVQADNTMAGEQAGDYAAKFLRRKYGKLKGRVLQLRGDLSQTVTIEREAGFMKAFSGASDVSIINRDTAWQPRLFGEATREIIGAEPVDVIYMHSDTIGVPEVLPVLRQLGLLRKIGDPDHICIVGVDGGPPALDGIRQGFVDAVASQPLTKYGVVVNWIEQELKGQKATPGPVDLPQDNISGKIVDGPNGPLLQLPTQLITRENVERDDLWGNQAVIREVKSR